MEPSRERWGGDADEVVTSGDNVTGGEGVAVWQQRAEERDRGLVDARGRRLVDGVLRGHRVQRRRRTP